MVMQITVPVGKQRPELTETTDTPEAGAGQAGVAGQNLSVVSEEPMDNFGEAGAQVEPAGWTTLGQKLGMGAPVAEQAPRRTNLFERFTNPPAPAAPPADFAKPPPIPARHASPHDFDRFNWPENTGSGEGNQMITQGTYVSTSPGVHKSYVNKFGGSADKATQDAINELRLHIDDMERGQAHHLKVNSTPYEPFTQGIAEAQRKIQALEAGQMSAAEAQPWKPAPAKQYDLRIHANDAEMLDWAKPIEGQPLWQKIPMPVKQAIEDLADERGINGPLSAPEAWTGKDLVRALEHHDIQEMLPDVLPLPGGKKASSWLEGTDAKTHVAAYLHSLGVPGVRYPAVGGKLADKPNYVIFDDKNIEIIKKYGLAGLLGAGGLAASGSGEQGGAQAQGLKVVSEAPMEPEIKVVGEEPMDPSGAPGRGGTPDASGAGPSPPTPEVPLQGRRVPEPQGPNDPAIAKAMAIITGQTLPPPSQQEAVLSQGRTPMERVVSSIPNPANVPGRVAEDFKAGLNQVQTGGALEKVMGLLGMAGSGVTGIGKAMVRDPIINATGDVAKAEQAETLATALPGSGIGRIGQAGRLAKGVAPEAPIVAGAARPPVAALPPPSQPGLPARIASPAGGAGGPPTVPPDVLPPPPGPGGPALPPPAGARPGFNRATEYGEVIEPVDRELSAAEKAIQARIQQDPTMLERLKGLPAKARALASRETADTLVTQTVDNLYPFRRFDEAAETVRAPGEATIHELARLTRGSPGNAQHSIRYGTTDFATGQVTGPGLAQIVKGVNAKGLETYMAAARALELEGRGIKSGFPIADAQKVVAETGQYYARVFEEVKAYQDRILKYYKDAGFISNEGYKLIQELNKDYVPLKRVLDEIDRNGIGKGLGVREVVRAIKGSEDYKTVSPLKSIVENTYMLTSMAERNRALTAFVDRAKRLQDQLPGKPLVETGTEVMNPRAVMGNNGAPQLTGPALGEQEIASNMGYLRGRAHQRGDDTITVFENGRPKHYRTTPELAAAARDLGEKEMAFLTDWLSWGARGLRHGVTNDPVYVIRNIARDQVESALKSQSGYRPWLEWLSGAKSIARGDEQYRAWLRHGGSQSGRYSTEFDPVARDLNMVTSREGVGSRLLNRARHPIQTLESVKNVAEDASRVGEFKLAMRKLAEDRRMFEVGPQLPPEQAAKGAVPAGTTQEDLRRAAFRSRDVSVDFQMGGANKQLEAYNTITAFMRSNIGGTFRDMQTLKNRTRQSGEAALALIAMPSVYLWLQNHNDPRYRDMDRKVRDNNWVFLPADPGGKPVLVPKPFLPGQIGSGIERTLDALHGTKDDPFKGYVGSVADSANPLALPTVVKPFMEHALGQSFWRGGPLDPKGQEQLAPGERGSASNSGVARRLGSGINLSPNVIDNYIQGLGGTLAAQGSHLPDRLLRRPEHGEAPLKEWSESPFIRRLFARNPAMGQVTDFYDNAKKMREAKATGKLLMQQGREADAQEYTDAFVTRLDRVQTQLGRISKAIRETEMDPKMTAAEKREQMLGLVRDQIEIARNANAAYNEAVKGKRLEKANKDKLDGVPND